VGANGFLEPYNDVNYQEEYEEEVNIEEDENLDPPLMTLEMAEVSLRELGLSSGSSFFKYTADDDQDYSSSYSYRQKKKPPKETGKKGPKQTPGKKGPKPTPNNKGPKQTPGSKGPKNNIDNSNTDKDAPIIRSLFPAPNTKVGKNQAFGALVTDNTGIKQVCVQLKDHFNKMSDCYDTVHVGNDIWEITFDGFGDYDGKTWSFRVQGTDTSNNREITEWTKFIIDSGSGNSFSESTNGRGGGGGGGGRNSANGGSSGGGNKLTATGNDDSWPYGGQYSLFRIRYVSCSIFSNRLLIYQSNSYCKFQELFKGQQVASSFSLVEMLSSAQAQ
jgi:uncharacterized membrane protein YgcG